MMSNSRNSNDGAAVDDNAATTNVVNYMIFMYKLPQYYYHYLQIEAFAVHVLGGKLFI